MDEWLRKSQDSSHPQQTSDARYPGHVILPAEPVMEEDGDVYCDTVDGEKNKRHGDDITKQSHSRVP